MGIIVNDEFKKQMDSNLTWLSATNTTSVRHYSTKDVTISRCAPKSSTSKNKSIRYNFTMRNKTSLVLGEWVDIAIYKNRIFFKPSTQQAGGLKMYSHNGKSKTNPFLQVTEKDNTKILSEFIGDYDMRYDDFYELYYIERPTT